MEAVASGITPPGRRGKCTEERFRRKAKRNLSHRRTKEICEFDESP